MSCYCVTGENIKSKINGISSDELEIEIDGSNIKVNTEWAEGESWGGGKYTIPINFCPFCGRELGDS